MYEKERAKIICKKYAINPDFLESIDFEEITVKQAQELQRKLGASGDDMQFIFFSRVIPLSIAKKLYKPINSK